MLVKIFEKLKRVPIDPWKQSRILPSIPEVSIC